MVSFLCGGRGMQCFCLLAVVILSFHFSGILRSLWKRRRMFLALSTRIWIMLWDRFPRNHHQCPLRIWIDERFGEVGDYYCAERSYCARVTKDRRNRLWKQKGQAPVVWNNLLMTCLVIYYLKKAMKDYGFCLARCWWRLLGSCFWLLG